MKEKILKLGSFVTVSIIVIGFFALPEMSFAADNQAQADAEKLLETYKKHGNKFDLIHGNSIFYGMKAEEAEAALKTLEDVEKEAIPEVQPILALFAEKYGVKPMDINNKLRGLGVETDQNVGNRFERLYEGANNIIKSRKATAEDIARKSKNMLSYLDSMTEQIRVKRMQDTKALLTAGQKFDPNNKEINQMLANMDQQIAELAEQIEKDIDARTWKSSVNDFPGPGKTDELTKAALDFFKNDDRWGKNKKKKVDILAVSVQGPWKVAERNIFGQVIQWRLPIHLAITNESLKAKNIAQIYELSMVTLEGAPNQTPKQPPFEGYWVGENWMMRLNKMPKGK